MLAEALELCATSPAVHGVDGLYVADASIMPAITRGNINLPTAMIGARVAAGLLKLGPSRRRHGTLCHVMTNDPGTESGERQQMSLTPFERDIAGDLAGAIGAAVLARTGERRPGM